MTKKKNYKILGMLSIINNNNLPSPIRVKAGFNSISYANKFFENKVLDICKRYNYKGILNITTEYVHTKNNKKRRNSKSVLVLNDYKCLYPYKQKIKDNNIEED